ncbi:MAG: transposase, OrfB family protein [Streptomyces oryziradicis]|jgi:IS605 OrfB family transposase|nr:transposase, OrfB family protein [Actinacidiphila oryziradicis]
MIIWRLGSWTSTTIPSGSRAGSSTTCRAARITATRRSSPKLRPGAPIALTRLLHWARRTGVAAIAVEDLDFAESKTREQHGRKKRFRQLISRFPTTRLRTRLAAMAAEQGIAIVAVDPAYTSRWGATPVRASHPQTTGHDCASIVTGRRAQ